MPLIKGTLTVTNKDWKYVYNSVLNFLNEEINNAYLKANAFYKSIKTQQLALDEVIKNFDTLIETHTPSTYQKSLINSALFSGTNSYIYSPKKNNFKKFTNRTTYVDTGSIRLNIDKKNCTIDLETETFDDFDSYILVNTFLSEFINMVNTIPWPTRNGPSKAIRGCKLFTVQNDQNVTIFYKSGPRPPQLNNTYNVIDTTVDEPNHLASSMMKSMHFVSSTQEETSQPIPEAIAMDFDDF